MTQVELMSYLFTGLRGMYLLPLQKSYGELLLLLDSFISSSYVYLFCPDGTYQLIQAQNEGLYSGLGASLEA